MSLKILTLGSCYYSMDLDIHSMPAIGGTTDVKKYTRYPDGSGINTAVALSKLETDCILVSAVGGDSGGKLICDFMSRYLSDATGFHIARGVPVGTAFHIDDADGGRRSLVFEGANDTLTARMVDDGFALCPDAAIINGDVRKELVAEAILAANTQSIPTLVNLLSKQAGKLETECFSNGTILVIDQENVFRYCGMRVGSVDDCLKACIALENRVNARYFVVRLKGKGSFVYNRKYYYFVPNYDFIPTDERGGEEYYNAALLLRFMLENDIRMACEFAAVAETVAMLRDGGPANLPMYDDIAKFIVANELDRKLLV